MRFLKRHFENIHAKSYQCEYCHKMFSKFGLGNHMTLHTGKICSKCNLCGKEYNKNDLYRHINDVQGKKIQMQCM